MNITSVLLSVFLLFVANFLASHLRRTGALTGVPVPARAKLRTAAPDSELSETFPTDGSPTSTTWAYEQTH